MRGHDALTAQEMRNPSTCPQFCGVPLGLNRDRLDLQGRFDMIVAMQHLNRRILPLARTATVVVLSVFVLVTVAIAQTRYVEDRFEITLRSGQSTGHAIVRMLPTGTRLTVLEVDADAGYTRVRTPDSTEGWVLSRLLMNEAPARDQLAAARGRIDKLQSDNRLLNQQVASLTDVRTALEAQVEELTGAGEGLNEELARVRRVSADALGLARENDELKAERKRIEVALEQVRTENMELRAHTTQRWFMIGAGVLGAGILTGLILPRLKSRRRRWDSL